MRLSKEEILYLQKISQAKITTLNKKSPVLNVCISESIRTKYNKKIKERFWHVYKELLDTKKIDEKKLKKLLKINNSTGVWSKWQANTRPPQKIILMMSIYMKLNLEEFDRLYKSSGLYFYPDCEVDPAVIVREHIEIGDYNVRHIIKDVKDLTNKDLFEPLPSPRFKE